MFALIITIISIALVAALALATIYYGGTAFNRNSTEIKAAEIMLQQQQIRAALTLYKADHEGKAPQNLQTLISSNYLRQIPSYSYVSPDPSLLPAAHAAEATPWIMPAEFTSTFVLAENVSTPVCAEVNFKARAFRGIPNQLYTSQLPVQCYYSSDKQSNIIVATDDIATISNALTGTNITPTNPSQPFTVPFAELNTSDPSIDPNTPSKWQNPPSEFAPSTGGTGGTGSTDNFNVSLSCSNCNAQTENLSTLTSFGREVTITASNIGASHAGQPITLNLSSTFALTADCYNEVNSSCNTSNPNVITFTPNQGSSASITLYLSLTPTRLPPGSVPNSTSGTTTITSQAADSDSADNAVSFTTTATNLDSVIIPPYTGYTPSGQLIIYEGYTPVNWYPYVNTHFGGSNPIPDTVWIGYQTNHNFDVLNFTCAHDQLTAPCYLRPGTYPEGPTNLTFQIYTPTYDYVYVNIPIYITHAPNPYQANAIANDQYPPYLWR